ncbi:GPP34 family phosphoprotein [Streptomyces rishiriensis]|uniref:GPP34 family phosphoprotein n=1 Tax=Streptomyces rishiriensis TaxID=68264 RepID=UPI000D591FFF|nr:GPP34 family phosphoprotein [Streptomyces rishiriensis]
MTTARDLMIVALEVPPLRDVGQGDLSLALAGAEAVDLVRAGAFVLDGDLIVPGPPTTPQDPLLAAAESSFVRTEPYESVEDWLWRRGRELAAAYAARMAADGLVARPRGRLLAARSAPMPVDSPARQRATARWASDEPVLATLATALGLREEPAEGFPGPLDEAVVTVLASTGDALAELQAVRQRRSIEDAGFDNMWQAL